MTSGTGAWDQAVSKFGADCAEKLAGPGDREAAIRTPLANLVSQLGQLCRRPAVLHDEVRDAERRVRPDYGVSINQVMMGYIEVKAPGRSINPQDMTGHDLEQWTRQRDLPNLIYTNGTSWRLYRDGELIGQATLTDSALIEIGAELRSNDGFQALVKQFLDWNAAAITSVGALVHAIAPLTRLLRGDVLDQLAAEKRAVDAGAPEAEQPFTGLASDWRRLLFPQASDDTFADGYAQAVTFALLLARTTGIELQGRSLHDVGRELITQHSLMGRALQLLTDDVAADFKVALDMLTTVVGAVRWERIRQSRRDIYLYLYEEFLAEYDEALRQASGTYYTPREVVNEMVRLANDVIVSHLGVEAGFAAPQVFTVDPAMGTGTFLQSIVERVGKYVREEQGEGAEAGALAELATRLAGFELQMGPFAVAELRISELLAGAGASVPAEGLKLYVTDTLDDPTADVTQISYSLNTIARSRREANELKRNQKVNVVIGNPPYRELAAGQGGWVENGSASAGHADAILDNWLEDVPGRISAKLKNLYVYFWRWATWKVWESIPADETGLVCFITTSGYLTGSAFTDMRKYIRQQASAGWIIDLTPEGQTPDVPTRIFPGVRQPLAIGIFVRSNDASIDTPADLRYRSLRGRRAEKFDALKALRLDAEGWEQVRTSWTAPFTAAAQSAWDDWPTMDQLMPWYSPGIFPTRTWVYSPSESTLRQRWSLLVGESDPDRRRVLMKDTTGAMETQFGDIPGYAHSARLPALSTLEAAAAMEPVITIGYRAFDRQKLIADPRLIHRTRAPLWEASGRPNQVYVVELHTTPLRAGPALVFSALIPDFHHFKGSEGGRTLPYLHPNGSANFAKGLRDALSSRLDLQVADADILAYIAAVAGHRGFTRTFSSELATPGVHIPITGVAELWTQAVELGRSVLWAHTYGKAFADGNERPSGNIAFARGSSDRILNHTPVTELPTGFTYDVDNQRIEVGGGTFGPVSREAIDYEVGGRKVVKSWIDYRSKEPAGKRSSPLDDVNPTTWDHSWTQELNELLTLVTRLVRLEPEQDELLTAILDAPLITVADLTACGVVWPSSDGDRRPQRSASDEGQQAAFDI
ncbi:type ISP restriction/modification enzyme [Mycobacterium sp. 360MFTsu5.1]|uniref:type ISP restriction/modification enzyme n=1 Tax=Mycobacterium sp. 360MFTsu5.1 TaxID=1172186 RepID=UPI0003A1504C|nr:type ISP restriction/modification enzyme [Mycobacterium sp. 360MFTsu5.1]